MKLKDGYCAKDGNGDVYWYDEMPVKGQVCWDRTINSSSIMLNCILQIDGPWEDSLHRVEDGKIIKVQTFKKDQKVLVSNDNGKTWMNRYYSHFAEGKHYVFSCGADSWSANDNQVVARQLIKSAEEE